MLSLCDARTLAGLPLKNNNKSLAKLDYMISILCTLGKIWIVAENYPILRVLGKLSITIAKTTGDTRVTYISG